MLARVSLALLCSLTLALPAAAEDWPQGNIPTGADGKPLNLDFETGDLRDWTADGPAFQGQPIEGDVVSQRRNDMRSGHRGRFWIGGWERNQDPPTGTLASQPFKITQPFASFLVGGGAADATRVELVDAKTGDVLFKVSGEDREDLRPVVVDLAGHQGKDVLIRLVDEHAGGWGHVNFDEFRFHAARPKFPTPERKVMYRGLPPDEAAAAMTLPPGFKVTLFAGEPDVRQPIAMTIDDRGRLWVAEGLAYPQKRPAGQGEDTILVFEDADGDGHFDSRKVFIKGLNLVSGLEVGFGGVWVGQAPELLFIPDKDGDDVPDGPPQVLLDGWHHEDTHETLNSFIWGPDGWLYGCHGVFTHSRVGKPDTPDKDRTPINAGIWRYHPTRHEFEVFAHGTSNPWGVDFDDRGQCFLTCCVIPHLFHVVPGGRYQRQAGPHFNPYTYDDIKTIAKHRHWVGNQWNQADRNSSDDIGGGHAHAGAMIYLGNRWPAEYRGRLFMNNIHGDRINQDRLSPAGSGYVGDFAPDFLKANDEASQILYLRSGPDGNVYAIDWYDTNECHRNDVEAHDRSNGRVYKISYAGDAAPNHQGKQFTVKPGASLKDLSSEELVALQLHENEWYVRQSRRILQERGPDPEVHEALAKIAFNHPDETRRLRGLWALHVTGGLNVGTFAWAKAAFNDESPQVRGWAIRLATDSERLSDPKWFEQIVAGFLQAARNDDSPVVRLALASACQRLPLDARKPILAALLGHGEDADDHNIPLMLWYATEPLAAADPEGTLALVTDAKIPLVRAFTLRRIAEIGTDAAIGSLVAALEKTDDAGRRREFLAAVNEALKGRRRVPMPTAWAGVYAGLLTGGDKDVIERARALAVTFGDPGATAEMRSLLADETAPADVRQAAMASLLAAGDKDLAPALQGLVTDRAVGREAIRGLAAYSDPNTPVNLLDAYPALTPDAKRDALNTLAARPEFAKPLLAAVEAGQIARTDLSADVVRQMRNLNDASITAKLNEVWGIVRETAADRQELVVEYKSLLAGKGPTPDPHVGRAVFNKTCAQCHKLFGTGGEVGPELTGSNRRDLDYLLSNVVDPSAVMAKDYQPAVIVTVDGRVITGVLKRETPEAVTVATANETIVVPRSEIDEMARSATSMMPDNIWQPLKPHEIRSLVAYLGGSEQVAPPADNAPADNAPADAKAADAALFNGRDLTGWKGDAKLFKVADGELVGTSPGIKKNAFLVSERTFGDFDLTVEVKMVPNSENSGIQFRSEPLPDGEMRGYQADMGAGWWGKLYEESGRGLLWDKSGEAHLKPDDWNVYRVRAVGDHVQTWLNGKPCVDLKDPEGRKRGAFGLQLHSGGPLTVRWRNFKLAVDPQ